MAWFRYEGGWTTYDRTSTVDGYHGAMVPGGRSQALFITVVILIALVVEVVSHLANTQLGPWFQKYYLERFGKKPPEPEQPPFATSDANDKGLSSLGSGERVIAYEA